MKWDQLPSVISEIDPPMLYQCERGWSWRNPRIKDFDLWIVLGGEGWISAASRHRVPQVRGSGILFRPGDAIQGGHNPDKPLRVFALHFRMGASGAASLCRVVPRWLTFHDPSRLEAETRELLDLPGTESAAVRGMRALRLASLLALAARDAARKAPDPVDQRIIQLVQEIRERPGETWEGERLARRAGLSIAHFNRRFRRVAGDSLARFVIQRRVDRARQLLRESPLSIGEIAGALGYTDVYYFHRQFRTEAGMTPGQYRRRAD